MAVLVVVVEVVSPSVGEVEMIISSSALSLTTEFVDGILLLVLRVGVFKIKLTTKMIKKERTNMIEIRCQHQINKLLFENIKWEAN